MRKKKYWPWLLLAGLLSAYVAQAQQPLLTTARVDTAQPTVRQVVATLRGYFRAHPDSAYANPYWNAAEVRRYVAGHQQPPDLAAPFLFNGLSARQTFAVYQPTVLSVEPAGEARYVARVLLFAPDPPAWVRQPNWNPLAILRYYAAPDSSGRWQLANSWDAETSRWRTLTTPWVRFHYTPGFVLDSSSARRASAFCDSVVAVRHLAAARPFDYYLAGSEQALGQLFNFEYWLGYSTGFTQKAYNRTFSGRGRVAHRHEFVHMLYPDLPSYFLAEGIATYLGGVDGYTPYRQTLRDVALDLWQHHPQLTYRDLYDGKLRYATSASPRYVAAALAYEVVQQRAGSVAVLEQSQNTYESFLQHFAAAVRLAPARAEALLNQQLRAAAR